MRGILAAVALVVPVGVSAWAQLEMLELQAQIGEVEQRRAELAAMSETVQGQIERVDHSISRERGDLAVYDYNLEVTEQRLAALHTRAAAKRGRITVYRSRLSAALRPVAVCARDALGPDELSLVAVAERYRGQIAILEEDLGEIEAEIARLRRYREREHALIAVADGNIEGHTERRQRRQRTLEEIEEEIAASNARLDALIVELERLRPSLVYPGAIETRECAFDLPPPDPMPVVLVNLPEIQWSDDGAATSIDVIETGRGLEFEVPVGTVIRALQAGEVIYAGPLEGFGEVVIIEHEDGAMSVTASVSEVRVEVGDDVHIGAPLAVAGVLRQTGAPGFHFEVRRGGEVISASQWIGRGDLRAALMGR